MDALETWTRCEHTDLVAGRPTTHPVWRKGSGPGAIVVHEVPGLTTGVIAFAEEVVSAGYTVLLPHLFGRRVGPSTAWTSRGPSRGCA